MESQIIRFFCDTYWLTGRLAVSLAFLGVAKAFDSVLHGSLLLAAATEGLPEPLVM